MEYCRRRTVKGAILTAVVVNLLVGAAALAQSGPVPAGTAARPKAQPTAPEPPPAKSDPFLVPNGTPAELLKYIEDLKDERPSSDIRGVAQEFLKKQSGALLEAAERILAAKPTPEEAQAAALYKVVALGMLDRLGDPTAAKRLEEFPAQLEKAGRKDLVHGVRGEMLQNRLRRGAGTSKADLARFVAEVKQWLGEGEFDRTAVTLAMDTARAAEMYGTPELAIQTYGDFSKLLAKSPNRNVVNLAATMQGAARRLGLLGKRFTLSAASLDTKPFQWSKYKGKVVLVNFFATWCGPCRAEMPNIAKCYEAYHDRGFEVVGISIDQDRKVLENFVEQGKHPWTIVQDNTEAAGTDQSMATYYGIFGLPQMILVDRDGKVVALNARGPLLKKELAKLLGPLEEKQGPVSR